MKLNGPPFRVLITMSLLLSIPGLFLWLTTFLLNATIPKNLSPEQFLDLVRILAWPASSVLGIWFVVFAFLVSKILTRSDRSQPLAPAAVPNAEGTNKPGEPTQSNGSRANPEIGPGGNQVVPPRDSQYGNLLHLWMNGVRDYHGLMSAYLTGNAVFVAAIGVVFANVEPPPAFGQTRLLAIFLCVAGLVIALQMAVALGRFRSQNTVWERWLRYLEQTPNPEPLHLFTRLYEFREEGIALPPFGKERKPFQPNWAVRAHRHWWARRAQLLPYIFGSVYVVFLIANLWRLWGR